MTDLRVASDGAFETMSRGRQVLDDARINRGVAFTEVERRALGLIGLLPPQTLSAEEQARRAFEQYERQPGDLAKHVFLSLLRDRNEVLFFRLLADHLGEMLPIIYTPTVGEAIAHYSHEYQGPRGVFLSADHPEDIDVSLANTGLGPDDVDLIVATDGEAILGIGDWGVGGISISIGKLSVYTAAGGLDPDRCLPVVLDVGTERDSLREDPVYLGSHHARVATRAYDNFVDAFVSSTQTRFPHALLHWEDLARRNSMRVLERHRQTSLTFNDDMQGTGAVILAAVISGSWASGTSLSDHTIVIFGTGTAGTGIAHQLAAAMAADGLGPRAAAARIYCLDAAGLMVRGQSGPREGELAYARDPGEVSGWRRDPAGRITLDEVVRRVAPTVLVGASGQPRAFTEEVVRQMAASCARPIILPLSNPTGLSEAVPADLLDWTAGAALVATGSPFAPVSKGGVEYVIAQANNALVFPGLGLGAVVARASRVTDSMLRAAATAVAGANANEQARAGSPLLPVIESLRETSVAVAVSVARASFEDGVAGRPLRSEREAEAAVRAAMWQPVYRSIRAT